MKVIVASSNPVKIKAVLEGFRRVFSEEIDVIASNVSSDVSKQPFGNDETYRGAYNRLKVIQTEYPQADFWVSIEGGIEKVGKDLSVFAWIIIQSKTLLGKSRSTTFFLPEKIAELVLSGVELGEAIDIFYNTDAAKITCGAIGLLTHNAIDRFQLEEQAVVVALIPFINENPF